jgi:hypothetical protein
MRRFPPRRSTLAALSVAGAAVVLTACGSGSRRPSKTGSAATSTAQSGPKAHGQLAPAAQTELAAAAAYLRVSVPELQQELRGGKSLAEVAAKTPGRTEAGLIAAITRQRARKPSKSVEQRVRAQVRARGDSSLQPLLSFREDAREYLGLTVAQLRQYAKGGKTLARIAGEIPGRSEAGLIDAIFGARERQLEAAVKAGTLRADVERLTLLHLRDRVRTYVRRFEVGQASGKGG